MPLVGRFRHECDRPTVDRAIRLHGSETIDHDQHPVPVLILFHLSVNQNEIPVLDELAIDFGAIHRGTRNLDREDIMVLHEALRNAKVSFDILLGKHRCRTRARRSEDWDFDETVGIHSFEENTSVFARPLNIAFLFERIEIEEEAPEAFQIEAELTTFLLDLADRRHLAMLGEKLFDRLKDNALFLGQNFHSVFLFTLLTLWSI